MLAGVQSWHGDDRSKDLGGLRSENRICHVEHLLVMMNFVAGGRRLQIEAIVLWDLFTHVGRVGVRTFSLLFLLVGNDHWQLILVLHIIVWRGSFS